MAVEIPELVKRALAREMAPLFDASLPGLRPVHSDGLHVTVKFLGDIPVKAIANATSALTAAARGFAPVRLHPVGGGVYPGTRRRSWGASLVARRCRAVDEAGRLPRGHAR